MARKEFTYRGKTIEELKQLPQEEMVALLPSRVRRNFKRGLNAQSKKFLSEVKKAAKNPVEGGKPVVIKTHCRDFPVLPAMVGLTIGVYSGKEFINVEINPEMIGHYLGEFSITCKQVKHSAPGIGATRSSMFVPLK
ncbi:30S ribosomal protein S19 [uncultured archaeon]|nr:30S ribosomal protein S19 [uncultured archaeon]